MSIRPGTGSPWSVRGPNARRWARRISADSGSSRPKSGLHHSVNIESPGARAYPLPVPRETYLQLFRLTCPHPDCRRVNTGRALVTAAGPKFAAARLLRANLKCKYCGGVLDQATEINLHVEVASAGELKSWK